MLKVSIITPTFNSERTIKDTLNSVIKQKNSHIEHIIVDGGSADCTIKIVEEYIESNISSLLHIKFISEKDNGIYDAINKGIILSTGDIVGILNSDDYFLNDNVIEVITEAIEKHEVDCVYGNLLIFDKNNKKIIRKWKSQVYKDGLFQKSWTPAHPTFYCKRKKCLDNGLYQSQFKIAADVELMLRYLQIKKIKSYFIDEYLIGMRKGGRSTKNIFSTFTITKEVCFAFKLNNLKLNVFKYLLHKIFKIKEYID